MNNYIIIQLKLLFANYPISFEYFECLFTLTLYAYIYIMVYMGIVNSEYFGYVPHCMFIATKRVCACWQFIILIYVHLFSTSIVSDYEK